jgi:hypothetical protein
MPNGEVDLLNPPIRHGGPGQPHPLGPLVRRNPWAQPAKTRLIAAVVMLACGVPLVASAWLSPDASGIGTHRQLGYMPCLIPAVTGYPCPTCGMTTAFAHAVRGRWFDAFRAQPMGWVLAVAAMAAVALSLAVLVSGRGWSVNWYRISPVKVILLVVLLFAAAWVYKIMTLRSAAGW